MDRFTWSDGILTHDEQLVCQQNGVRLYDGNDKAKIYAWCYFRGRIYFRGTGF